MTRRRPHPFRELRQRDHIAFRIDPVANEAGGAVYARRGDRAAIVISPELDRLERTDALAHELEHDELGVVSPPATEATMQRVEHLVEQRVTAWLIPPDELRAYVEAREDHQGIDAAMVAEHFDSTVERAQAALEQLVVARRYEAALIAARAPELPGCTTTAAPSEQTVHRPSPSYRGEPWA